MQPAAKKTIAPESILESVGRAIGKQRAEIDAQFKALRDQNDILVNRLLRSANLALDAFLESIEDADEYCQANFGVPLTEALGEFFFAKALTAPILRSDGAPLVKGKGSKDEHLRISLLRTVERICGRPVSRGFHDTETANAQLLRSKAEYFRSLADGLSGDPRGAAQALYCFHTVMDGKALGANHATLKPVEVKLAQARDSLSVAANQWSACIDKFGYQPHRQALAAHKQRSDAPLPPAYANNPIAKACQACAAHYEQGQPYRLRVLRESNDDH